jgi:predicted Zn-dependent protease
MSKKAIGVTVAILCLAGGGAGAWWWNASAKSATAVASGLPAQPDLSSALAVLRERVTAAAQQARSTFGARAGLAKLAQLYYANGFLDEAAQCYTALEQLEPHEPRWPHLHAHILAGYGDIEPAMQRWRRVVELAPDYLPARLRLGDSALKANRMDEAAAAYTGVLARDPQQPHAQFGLARVDLEAGREDQALERLEQLVKQTNYAFGYDLIVTLYEKRGQLDRAAAIRGAYKASGAYRDPVDPWLDELIEVCFDPYRLSLQAGFATGNGDPAKGVQLLQRAIELTPNDVAAHLQLGVLYLQQRNLEGARQEFERCTVIDPKFADGWAQLSALQARLGESAQAERTLAEGLQHCPEASGLHLMRARNLRQAGRIGEAIGEFRTSIRLRPNEPEAYLELGNMLIGVNRTEEGLAEIRRALETDPANPSALATLAYHAITTNNETEARQWMARVGNQPRIPRDQFAALTQAYRKQFGRDWR